MSIKPFNLLAAALGFVPWWLFPNDLRAEEAQAAPARSVMNLEFPGGTVADYVQAVLKSSRDVNVVVMPEAREFEVPPLQLSAVDVGTAIELLDGRKERRGRGVVELGVEERGPFDGNGRAIFTISSSMGPLEGVQPDEAGVWTVSDLLGGSMKSEDVLTAIQTAMELISGPYGPAEIRFHEETGLIIAHGHVEQMHMVEQVIKRLREGLRMRRGGEPSAGRAEKEDSSSDGAGQTQSPDRQAQQVQMLVDRLAKAEKELAQLRIDKEALASELAQRAIQIQELRDKAK